MIRFGDFEVCGFVAACIALYKNNVAKRPARTLLLNKWQQGLLFGGKEENMSLKKDHAGVQIVKDIFANMKIDKKWSIASDRAFTWWGHRFAQTVWADQSIESAGTVLTKVHAETDFLKFQNPSTDLDAFLAMVAKIASLNGYIVFKKEKRIKLRCNALIHKGNQSWLGQLFSLASIMQVVEAETICDVIAEKFEIQPDHSCHPQLGPRQEMDGMLNLLDQWVIPEGQKPMRGISEAEFNQVSQMLNNQNILTTASPSGLTAYVPFGRDVSLLQVNTNQPHPLLGNGILLRLSLPPEDLWPIADINGPLIMDMNLGEQKDWLSGHFLGSWYLGPAGKNSVTPVFVSFIPAVACVPTVIINMIYSMIGHNTWSEGYFFAWDRREKYRNFI